jgi:uncharacterized protein YecE (DUF72 family)
MAQWRIGCSGFYYNDWKNIFYPEGLPQRKWFEYYCRHFNTVELNVTFYRFPKLESFQTWYDRSPENFTFCVKAPRLITHYKRFKDAQLQLMNFYERISQGLREKAGCVLFQFPTTFVYDEEALNMIISLLDKSFVNVLEFRHQSWWNDNVYCLLTQNNITFCGMSHPQLPDHVIKTSETIYYRFHGVPQLYHSQYDVQTLQQISDKISSQEKVADNYLYFNNTANGTALVNAKQVQEYLQVSA